ncbi:LysR family transcriptional regulator [Emcibacter nanhaiensis]|uniref:LysR family transcriptional regulator n=1 Tax=Emcibacter nanhaiensis TaxID=1505037 RepID=A0A501PT31_9PROT|nr:LysR family transcriptional regulator [Emcibacter nanhaiensis]TPD63212.1 LysR family transcriptional regulator [Emcibacter nanhaiensis]
MHLKGLDLNLLIILDALLKERNVTKAADRVCISQPAASAALSKLRHFTGDELLQKVGRTFVLTPRAQALVKPVEDILRQIEKTMIPSPDFDPARVDRTFKIAMSSYVGNLLTDGIMDKLINVYPKISLDVESLRTDSVARVKEGKIDFCIATLPTAFLDWPEAREEYNYSFLFEDEWVVLASAENDLVTNNLTFEEFCALPYIETRLGRNLRTPIDQILDCKNRRPQTRLSVPHFELAITHTMHSDCITVVPSMLVNDLERPFLKMVRVPFETPTIEEHLIWDARNEDEPDIKWFRELLMEITLELGHSTLHNIQGSVPVISVAN